MPKREDILAIRSIEEAFDLSTARVTRREVALIRTAVAEGLVDVADPAAHAAFDEAIPDAAIWRTIERGRARSKELGSERGGDEAGIEFESAFVAHPRIRVRVSWRLRYFIAAVHAMNNL